MSLLRLLCRLTPWLALLTFGSACARAQVTIAQQPQPQTVQAGQAATFTAAASAGPCRTIIYKNGAQLKFGPMTGADGSVSYTTPVLSSSDSGEKFAFGFYACPGQSVTLISKAAMLTVTTVASLQLAKSSTALFDDGSPVLPGASVDVLEHQGVDTSGNPAWKTIGTISSDASGNLAGAIAVDWSFQTDGLVGISVSLLGAPAPGTLWLDPLQFQQGKTQVVFNLVLFKPTPRTLMRTLVMSINLGFLP